MDASFPGSHARHILVLSDSKYGAGKTSMDLRIRPTNEGEISFIIDIDRVKRQWKFRDIKIDESLQDSDAAKYYLRTLALFAGQSGARQIVLSAGDSVGGYAWARYGFEMAGDELRNDCIADIGKRIGRDAGGWHVQASALAPPDCAGRRYRLTDEQHELLTGTLALMKADTRQLQYLSDFTQPLPCVEPDAPPLKLGKAALLGTTWRGALDLRPQSRSWQRFACYTACADGLAAQVEHAYARRAG